MQFIKKHWRLALPLAIMIIIFIFSASPATPSATMSSAVANFLGLPHSITRKIAHILLYASLGATWYYYLRHQNRFTPGFTAFGSLLLVTFYASLDELHQTFVSGRSGQLSDVLLDAIAGLAGIILFATIYYLTRTKHQKTTRRATVKKIWTNNTKLYHRLKNPKK